MTDVYDAVAWRNLLALSGPVLAWADGSMSRWPTEALQALGVRVVGAITVLADERHDIFDAEAGDAGNDQVAAAVANRLQDRLHSTVYSNEANLPNLTQVLRRKGVYWTDAQFWPAPGCYLWAAAPGTTPGRLPAWVPVSPVAVQDRWMGGYDISTAFHGWPSIPTPEVDVTPADVEAIVDAVALRIRQLMVPGTGELYGRTVEACNESIKESDLARQPPK